MMPKPAVIVLTVLCLAALVAPATADEIWHADHGARWRAIHEAIYELEEGIAVLEADPGIDDGDKAPRISRMRAEIRHLQRTLPRATWRWTAPCCYSRRPIYIR